MITIVDYGMGNLGSVLNMFAYLKIPAQISKDIKPIEQADKLLLPGVGSYRAGMKHINESGLKEVLQYKALEQKVPILGICLGMQLLTQSSEEATTPGLGWVDAVTYKFRFDNNSLKVPHMGWNEVLPLQQHPLTALPEDARFYFVHSYYVKAANEKDVLMRAHYGYDFDAVITNGENIFGAQFHPEKSHKFGMKLFQNFAAL